MAGNYFGYAAAAGGPYGTQSGYAAGQAAYVAAGQAFAAAAANARSTFQAYETGPPGPAYAYSARPAVVTVAVGPQYHQAGAAGYDPGLYTAATTYYRQQQGSGKPGAMAHMLGAASADSMSKKLTSPPGYAAKSKEAPRPSQLHFCDICKIGCLGPQTYREHLEGQRHKKKEAAMSATTSAASKTCPTELRCDLCTVTCTGADAFAAHIKGSKHQRVLKLYAKLGKPVPEDAPAGVQSDGNALPLAAAVAMASAATSVSCAAKNSSSGTSAGGTASLSAAASLRVQPAALAKSSDEDSVDTDTSDVAAASHHKGIEPNDSVLPVEKLVAAVGQEYVEELRTEDGKVVSFHCKLCNCKFNDPNAKEMHVKGRRHRLQYKKKVDPNLDVDIKASVRKRRLEVLQQHSSEEEFIPMAWEEGDLHAQTFLTDGMSHSEEQLHCGSHIEEPHDIAQEPSFYDIGFARPRWPLESAADRLVRAKHDSIYPTEEELFAVQSIVAACETGLKLVSDRMPAAIPAADHKDSLVEHTSYVQEVKPLRSVVRVGALAKGLLLTGDLDVELVLLCSGKPTRQLLDHVAELLPTVLKDVADEEYEVTRLPEDAAVRVSRTAAPAVACTITLTSPVLRLDCADELTVMEQPDVLDRHKCLAALAAHRRARWFEAKAAPLSLCVVILRILKDMRTFVAPLAALNEWAVELLVEHCLSSVPVPMGLCDSLRRLWECIASGLLLPGGPGLADPCEKEQVDATEQLSLQQRDDLTAFAQRSLRMIAFGQLPKFLNMSGLGSDDVACGTKAKRPRQQGFTEQDNGSNAGEVKRNKSPQ